MKKQKRSFIRVSKVFLLYLIVLVIIGFKGKFLISFIFVFIHELVHYGFARKLGFNGFGIEILPIGTVLKLDDLDEATPKEDLIISISGPLVNLILACVFYFFKKNYSLNYLDLIYMSNLALGIFNLIPAFPLDGGRILRDILALKTYYKRANKITVNVSFVLGFFMLGFSIVIWILNSFKVGIFIISIFIIISSYKEKERIVYLIMGDIVRKKYKFLKKGYIENRSISMYYKKTLLEAISIIDKNKYTVFLVLDEDMKTIGVLYEEELIDGLKIYGNISIEQYLHSIDEIDKIDKLTEMSVEEWNLWKEKNVNED